MQTIEKNTLSNVMKLRDIPVFQYHIDYPTFHSTCNQRAVEAINAYYAAFARRKEHYCKINLYPQAADAARYISNNNPPFNYYEFDMNYTVTWNNGCIVSLYIEEYTFMGGAHGSTIRTSDTWDFATGKRLYLKDLCEDAGKESVSRNIKQQISLLLKTSPDTFFDGYEKLVSDTLNLNSFFLAPEGIMIYFQQYDIAPYAAGFPEFRYCSHPNGSL